MTRTIDRKATKAARAQQAAGIAALDEVFGFDREEHAVLERQRRQDQGVGGSSTRKHWSRSQRRRVTKAQRVARRRNRS